MRIVQSQARQIEDILADQEKFANESPATENVLVDEVVGEATHVIPKEANGKIAVEVDQELQDFRVHAHRIGLLQVMGNLILNAYESIQRRDRRKDEFHCLPRQKSSRTSRWCGSRCVTTVPASTGTQT